MQTVKRATTVGAATAMIIVAMLMGPGSSAQDGTKLAESIHIQAQAMGQAQQLGRSFGVNIIIEEYSTPDDQKALIDAFSHKKNEGLVNALHKMKSKGRMAITGTLGYDVKYIRRFDMPDGSTKFRLVTDRVIRFGELWSDNRSTDYSLSGAEIILSPDKKNNSGILLPACKFKINKENHLELDLLQNAWKLVNVSER